MYPIGEYPVGQWDYMLHFLGARYDFTCETIVSNMAAPMRERCHNLTEHPDLHATLPDCSGA